VTALFAAESIGKRFGRRDVLTSAGLWAHAGRVTALLGRNGSGKTTLVRIAAGWLAPDHGVVIFDGHRFTRPPWRASRVLACSIFPIAPCSAAGSPCASTLPPSRAWRRQRSPPPSRPRASGI
jgi:ABC-type cobalamin/Fe3+-siderophores transport system ATPase subunit